jgi:transposase
MDTKREFVELALQEGANRRELCRRFGISPKTGYALLNRYAQEGMSKACTPRSTRPLTSPTRSSPELEQAVIELRREHPTWGGRKIARRLADKGFGGVPASSTSRPRPVRPANTGIASSTNSPTLCGRSTSRATSAWPPHAATR